MSLKSRIEKLENHVGGQSRHRFIKWDRSRLTEAEAALIKTDDRGIDTQTFQVTHGTENHALAQSIIDKHSDIIEEQNKIFRMFYLIVIVPVKPGDV